ncbi:MAG TPA: acyltransferase [Edaphobacter sp.]
MSHTEVAPRLKHKYLPALDGIRIVAIGLVMLHHATGKPDDSSTLHHLLSLQRNNGIGHILFFVLSGALITTVIEEARHTENRYRNFILRRLLRIFPLYFGYLLLVLLVNILVTGSAPDGFWVYPLLAQNIFIQLAETTNSILPTIHLWSISVQDHFYLIWPLLVWRCKTLRQMRILCFSGIGLSILWRLLMLAFNVSGEWLTHTLPSVSSCMCFGGLLAVERYEPTRFSDILRRSLIPLTAVCLTWMWYGLDYSTPVGSVLGYHLVALICAALIAEASHPTSIASRILSMKLFSVLGRELSFGIYMFHLALLNLSIHYLPVRSKVLQYSFFLVSTIALSWLSYHFYEKPFLRLKIGRNKPAPALPAVEAASPSVPAPGLVAENSDPS